MRSTFMIAISETRFFSIEIRASTRRCRSLAAAYSAFSRRSPSSRALDFPGQLQLQLAIERRDFVLELSDESIFHRFRPEERMVPQCYASAVEAGHEPTEPDRRPLSGRR